MQSAEIRESFLSFFENKGSRTVRSSGLIPDDTSMLFTTAGMVQFKPYFLRTKEPAYSRAASVQKCVRTTDVDKVGFTARHLTFFEMLGNFSFGDYYKESTIQWAWEYIADVLKLEKERIYVTVYMDDDEALNIWKAETDVPAQRIFRMGSETNFWAMGATGPCGPCSEIHYDLGEEMGCGSADCGVDCECGRYLEIWNLVFMQFNRDEDGSLTPLPYKNIDTGMGLERIASVMQGVPTNYQIDTMVPIMEEISQIAGVKPFMGGREDASLKIITDHARSSVFLISEGVLPSNEERGYVLRRLIRRSIRHARLIGVEKPFFERMANRVIEIMGDAYPEIIDRRELVSRVLSVEEEKFSETLRTGLDYLKVNMDESERDGVRMLSGERVFYLHDTLGFPEELTREIAGERGFSIDYDGFRMLMEEQKSRARGSWEGCLESTEEKTQICIPPDATCTYFCGYDDLEAESEVKFIYREGVEVSELREGQNGEVIFDTTPFYAESGGQVGDSGIFWSEFAKGQVRNTRLADGEYHLHAVSIESGKIRKGDRVITKVDSQKRISIARHHTATHILHWALREVLGKHALQAGSYVDAERLRFDFTHYSQVTKEEINKIEALACAAVCQDMPVRAMRTDIEKARESGAIALFGERYSEEVRVVSIGDASKELCGGTHVERTGQIGPLIVIHESGIGSNTRRIEAVAGLCAMEHIHRIRNRMDESANMLKTGTPNVPGRIQELLKRVRELEIHFKRMPGSTMMDEVEKILKEARTAEIGDVRVLSCVCDPAEIKAMRDIADKVRAKMGKSLLILGSTDQEGRANMLISISKDLAEKGTDLDAGRLIKIGTEVLGGSGGGRPDMAAGGGAQGDKLEKAMERVFEVLISALSGGSA